MYSIKKYSYDAAKRLGVIIEPSSKGNFKIDVYDKQGDYLCSVGSKNFSDYPTYIQTHGLQYANRRRSAYHNRHRKDNGIRGYYALRLLW